MIHFVIILSIVFSFLRVNNKSGLYLTFFPLFIFSAFRYNYGPDYDDYYNYFMILHHRIPMNSKCLSPEIGFRFLNLITPDFNVLISIVTFFFLIIIFDMILKNIKGSLFIGLSCFIFLINPNIFLIYLSAIRQSIALIFFLIAVNYGIKRKIVPYCFCIFLAFLFHKSAIILLPMYFIMDEKPVKLIWIVFILIILFGLTLIGNTFFNMVNMVLTVMGNKNYMALFNSNLQNSLRATMLTSIYLFYVSFSIPHLKGKALVYSKLYCLGLMLGILAYKVSFVTRLQMYFDVFSIISLPIILKENFLYYKKSLIGSLIFVYGIPLILLAIYLLRYYSFFMNPNWLSFSNYHTILSTL